MPGGSFHGCHAAHVSFANGLVENTQERRLICTHFTGRYAGLDCLSPLTQAGSAPLGGDIAAPV